MNSKKAILCSFIILLLFSLSTPVFADDFSGTLSVNLNATSLQVGDTVSIIVIASNDGLGDWTNLKIYVPIPSGLEYVSHDMPDRVVKEYDPTTGIWNVYQMRDTGRGKLKEMIITCKVLPSAAGSTITIKARMYSLMWSGVASEGRIGQAYSPVAVVSSSGIPGGSGGVPPKNDTNKTGYGGNGTGPGGGGGNGTGFGNDTGSGINTVSITGNSLMDSAIENITQNKEKDPLYNSQTGGGGGGGKAYELGTSPSSGTGDKNSVYIAAVIAIIGLILIGYYYGIKKDR